MLENNTVLLSLQRKLKTAFKNEEKILVVELVTLFALVNIPPEYSSSRQLSKKPRRILTWTKFSPV
jgi:hypothetical protein